MRKVAAFWLIAVCSLVSWAGFAEEAEQEEQFVLRVHVTDRGAQIPALASMQLDVAGVDVKADTADFFGGYAVFQKLRDAGFDPQVVWTQPSAGALLALSQYLDPAEVSQKLDFYQSTYPSLAKKVQIATTAEGRAEYALKISDNVNVDEDEPVIFYVAQHHAREVMTSEIALDIIDYLLTRYASDAKVHAWVDGREIWVVPNHNPDGTNTVFTSNSGWRKNRRNNGDGSFGVDPNRNYPFHWNFCTSGAGASSATSNDTYRGPSAGSEPETQGYMQLARDQHPALALSYHTYSELVIHPYGCVEAVIGEKRMLRDFTSDMAFSVRNDNNDGWYSNGTPYELLYEVSGDSDGWFYGELGTVATTIEANSSSQGFQPDYNTWRDQTVLRNRPGWQYLLDRLDGPSIWGHTTNACTGAPVAASLGIDEIVLANGETVRTSEPGFGRFHRMTTPGSWHLNAAKSGFRTQDWPVAVGFNAVQREVRLVPTGSYGVEYLADAIQDGTGDSDGEVDPGEGVTMSVTAYATGEAVSGVTGTLSTSDPYVIITDAAGAWPAMGAGGTAVSSDGFGFYVSPGAPDGHVISFTLTFAAAQSLCAATSTFAVRVTTHAASCPAIDQPLDSNPGWTIQNSDGSGWAFGAPGGSGGIGGPPLAHTGLSVYGTNLTGNYADSADYKLITTPFNLTGLRNTELRFWRWLNNEAGYDLASIDVSTDGTSFTNVWSGFGRDTQWESYRIDISSIADGQPTVFVRFRLQSDVGTTASGFYLDDVSICGEAAAPAPSMRVTSFSINDGGDSSCTDHDAYADAGETVDVTVGIRNDGNATAHGVTATLSSSDPRIAMESFRSAVGDVGPGASANAVFRFRVASAAACGELAGFVVTLHVDTPQYTYFDTRPQVTLQSDSGTPVPDAQENFEAASGWTLTGEWQIGAPQAKGGTANGGTGTPDPAAAFGGTKVLGVDLSGLGAQLGNYENNMTTAITATSPVYDCQNSESVQVQFKRWLGVERTLYDKATIEVWTGSAWQTIWTNPDVNLSDSFWQSVSYDVSPWAVGNASFRVRFGMKSDTSLVFCGWNIDDLRVTNGYTPRVCETGACAAGCTPAAEITGVAVSKSGTTATFTWSASGDGCHRAGGASYRVYQGLSPARRVTPATHWPLDSFFLDATTADLDGSASNASFTDNDSPEPGSVLYYLIVDMGTNGAEGPKGWQGF